ncbi:N-formylglutamate deformylase [Asaia krungthepensis]|uniref:N-formylglutamate amidohydrolase n=1 Tax=Asaia krungthepensis NRIC 0535 TaxID=1307925 RepID=A0ABQ0Q3T8_9PROT|nr:N-formylglutamate deformylase [Asaia krungthepensis]GBQ90050.1 N-formylglutamate amidohydrolase [Asaia krungthepensis NRIC 0535]
MSETSVFTLTRGESPVLIALPHNGILLAPGMEARMSATGLARPDTDWHMERVYDFAPELGMGVIAAKYSRYVIDLNRGPDDATLYPGRPKTGLVPEFSFDGDDLYRPGEIPAEDEIAHRLETYWKPYHAALEAELERLRGIWGWAVLWDGHSIRSVVPRLFEGQLPDLNLGTNDGASCDVRLTDALGRLLAGQSSLTTIVNGRFKGGYTTRHYGQPSRNIHAIQMEMAQSTYMAHEQAPWTIDESRLGETQTVLLSLMRYLTTWRPSPG